MPDSQNPEHVRKLIQEFQLKGANLIPTITAEIVPTVLVADLTSAGVGPDDRLCIGGTIGTAPGAGNQRRFFFENPAGSGTICIFKRLWMNLQTAGVVQVRRDAGPAAAATVTAFRDTRLAGTPVLKTASVAAAAIVLGTFAIYNLLTTYQSIDMEWVIDEGFFLEVRPLVQNETATVQAEWVERTKLPGE